MLSTSTIEILKKLNSPELKRLGDFINSPYHNSTKGLDKIYKIVSKAYPDFTSRDLESEAMAKKVFGPGAYKEKRLKNLCAEFGNLLKKFIGHETLYIDKPELNVFIAKGLSLKHLFEISNKFIVKSIKENNDGLLSAADTFHYKFYLNKLYIENLGTLRLQETPQYEDTNLEVTEQLLIFFLRTLFSNSLENNTNGKLFEIKEDKLLSEIESAFDIKKILTYMESVNHKYYSFLKIDYLFYTYSFNDITEEQYMELKNLILNSIKKFTKDDKIFTIYKIFQLIHLKMVPLDKRYLEDILEFTNVFKNLNIYPDALLEPFNHGMFRDIFTTAIILKKFEWAENFADEFINYLSMELREGMNNFSKGILSFKRGKYMDSLNYFQKADIVDINDKIQIRFYYMMNLIEMKAFENALSSLSSFRQFCMESKEIPEMHREKIERSLKYFNEIIKCELSGERMDSFLHESLNSGEIIAQKQYIMEKMEKLK
ncbi:MAG: hypothetical protein JST55_15575 [Bacteroidetes bacterium]|nr:hypothetical protein [Bacteroidota bacterium]